jgi:hypothetical protein
MESVNNFQWGSLLGASVICFLIVGVIFALLGSVASVLGPLGMAKDTRFLYMSDKALAFLLLAPGPGLDLR